MSLTPDRISARRWKEDSYKARWIRGLLSEGASPRMDIIESGTGPWEDSERKWILHYRSLGARLTNATDGGEGASGVQVSDETREKLRVKMKHRVFTDEHRRRISAAKKGVITPAIKAQVDRLHEQMRGRKQSPEEKEKRASKLRGRKRPAELMERIRLSNIGQKRTPEQCRKMSGPRKKKTAVAA